MRWNREVDRAIVRGVAETEIQQIKASKNPLMYSVISQRFVTILMSAVTVLAILISKVLQKARELSAKFFGTEQIQPQECVFRK